MLPGARQALRHIGRDTDVVTTVSRYTRGRVAAAFGPTAALEPLPPGIDADRFRPDPGARAAVRRRHALGDAPVVTCVSRLVARKGQDVLIRALPGIRARVPGTRLAAGGWRTRRRAATRPGRGARGRGRGRVRRRGRRGRPARLPRGRATSSPCRAAPVGGGWTSRGWASRCWRRRRRGCRWWRGVPAARRRPCRRGGPGTSSTAATCPRSSTALVGLLADPARAAAMGAAGRAWMRAEWASPGGPAAALLDGACRPPPADHRGTSRCSATARSRGRGAGRRGGQAGCLRPA